MNENNKGPMRVLAIHDMSCFGRCSLSVILPALSTCGHQAIALPTALLSTHTGGFENMTFLDLTDEMRKILAHWETIGLDFDAVYSGFLGSEAQFGIVEDVISDTRKKSQNALVVVDPVLGDDGMLYQTITESMCDAMRRLVAHADVITPNITEAFLLLSEEFGKYDRKSVEDMAKRLSDMGPRSVVITGLDFDGNGTVATAAYDRENDNMVHFYSENRVDKSYPGTGDIFASVMTGKLLSGMSLYESACIASDFVYKLVAHTSKFDTPERNGVMLEKFISDLN